MINRRECEEERREEGKDRIQETGDSLAAGR